MNSSNHSNPPIGDSSALQPGAPGARPSVGAPAVTSTESPDASTSWTELRRPMYGEFYGVQEPPFDLTPNPKFLFLTSTQREALSILRYGLSANKGFTLLMGEAGTGKTTLVQTALAELGDTPNRYILVNNPTLGRGEFYEFLAREFGLSEEARSSKARFLADLQLDVEGRFAAGGLTGLIVDEAQSMPNELLEEIRLLGNIETPTTKLLSIVLSGQPELADRLNKPSLRQLKQRVALRCELKALTIDQTAAYISGRLRIAGASPAEVFTREAVIGIHEAAAGIARTVNVLCDNALIGGFAAQVKPIRLDTIEEVCRDFDLRHPETGAEPRRQPNPMVVPAPVRSPAPSNAARPAPSQVVKRRPTGIVQADERTSSSLNPPRKRRFSFFF